MYGRRHHLSERQAMEELGQALDRHGRETARVQEEYSAKWTPDKRREALKSGDALPGDPPKFPIKDQEDMDNANNLKGNSSIPNATIEQHMRKQARKHGLRLPPSLQSNSSS